MKTCICENCENLKDVIDAQSSEIVSQCEFDLPCEQCENCNVDGCDATCENFVPLKETSLKIVKCSECSKGMTVTNTEDNDGYVFCLDCYLKR